MKKAQSVDFRKSLIGMEQLYGDGKTSERIFQEIKKAFDNGIVLKKSFHDIDFEVRL